MGPWRCQRDGACCREPADVVMTHAERDALKAAAPHVPLWFTQHEDARFVRMVARPCPLLGANGDCTVYAVRPVNCRRYSCGRDDVTTEPWTGDEIPARFYRDRPFRRQLVHMQRKAMQQWGHRMGWSE